MKMKAAVLHGKEDIRLERVDVPELGSHDVLLKVKAAGICGSDIPRVLGHAAFFYPLILGHEFSGEIVQVGDRVTRVKPGDRAAGVPLLFCGRCEDCLKGNYAQCPSYSFIGTKTHGAFAEYVVMPEINALPLPDGLSFEHGAMVEPVSIAVHALRHMNFVPGQDVVILGLGTIGMFVLQCVNLCGARSITAVDISDERLALAAKYGADHLVNAAREDLLERTREITDNRGFEIVLECAGSTATMLQSFELAANKANVCLVGTPHEELRFPPRLFEKMHRKEFRLTGSWMSYGAPFPGRDWEMALQWIASGQIRLEDMIDRYAPLDQAGEMFQLYKKPGAVKGKIMFVF